MQACHHSQSWDSVRAQKSQPMFVCMRSEGYSNCLVCVCACVGLSAPFRPLRVKVSPEKRYQRFIATRQREKKLAIFLKMLRSKVMASFTQFVGVRRSCRALQFILTATEAAIATQKGSTGVNGPSAPLLINGRHINTTAAYCCVAQPTHAITTQSVYV